MADSTTQPTPADQNEDAIQSLYIVRDITIQASLEIVFESILDELGPEGQMPDGTPFPMKIEPWPGGRWYRDLGNNSGHFWGHVQVIKPPKLIEISGPMFMSYPAINFVQYRLATETSGTKLSILHRALGQIPADHRANVHMGWEYGLKRISELATRRKTSGSPHM